MNKRKLLLTICSLIVVMIVCLCVDSTVINAVEKSSDLFINSKNISVADNQTVPTVLKDKDGKDVQTTFDSGKNGVLLTSNTSGASVDLSRTFSGSFEVEFRVYSDTYFYDSTGTDYNSSVITVNPYCDLQELSITLTDDNGQSFDIVVSGGEKYNTVTAAARVRIGDAEFGYHYSNDDLLPTKTPLQNSGGFFTRIGSTTFSNVTRRGGETTTDSVPIIVGFNAETMEVYCYHYGTVKAYDNNTRVYRVIADLDSEDIGLYKFDNFDNYNVSFGFDKISEGKTAKMLIYSINNQKLSGDKLTDTIGPNTIAHHLTNSVAGVKYYLPEISTFDLLDESNNYKTIVSIKDASGAPLNLRKANGSLMTGDEIYEKGCYFVPSNVEGNITISYTSYDSKNKEGKTSEYTIYNYKKTPTSTFDYDGLESNYEVATKTLGDDLKIYPCSVTSSLYVSEQTQYAHVSLYKDGSVVEGFDKKVLESVEYVKLEVGTYKLVYFIDGFYNEDYSYEFTVVDNTPTVEFSSEILDKYICGEKVNIPQAKYTLNGISKRATAVLYDPDGKYVDIAGDVILDKIGTYKLTYMVNFDKVYTFDYYFGSFHSANGLFEEQKGVTAEYGNTGDNFKNVVNGVVLTFTKSDTEIKFGKVLDLSKNTKFDSLFEIITLPSAKGVADALQYTVKLTDVYDSRNYVTITAYKGSSGNQWSYIKAGATGQVLAGLENEKVLTTYEYGAPIHYSMTGENIVGNEVYQIFYDYAEKAIYADHVKRDQYSYGNLVIDMDNKEHFAEKTLWGGFTTGEVYLTISVQSLQTEKAQMLIKSINGVSFENEWIKDTEVPIVTIDTFGYSTDNLPVGVVNREYKLFPARAYDAVDGLIDYELLIYKDYQTMNQKLVSTNKKSFIPTEAGNYTLVYKVTDSSKNFITESIKFTVASKLDKLDYQFDANIQSSIKVGEYLEIPTGVASGGSGNVDVKLYVTDPNGANVEINKNTVFIEKPGKYTVEVTLKDYIGTEETFTWEVTSVVDSNPIISDLHYNPTMIEGYEYDLSNFVALDYYSNNGSPVDAIKSVKIIKDGKTITLDSTMVYKPEDVKNGQEITIQFIAKNKTGNGTTIIEKKANLLKIKDSADNLNLANLFYQQNIKSVNPTDEYIEYVTSTSGASLEYANYLIVDGFSMKLEVNKDMNNFGAIEITLVDSINSYQKVVLTINKSGKSISTASVNDVKNLSISSDFYQTTSQPFWFYFNAKANAIIDGNTNQSITLIKKNYDGSSFEGFTSGKIKATIKFLNVEGDSAIRISSISNQVIKVQAKDRIAPSIQLLGELSRIAEINQPFTVYRAVASDGIDPSVKVNVKITKGTDVIYDGEISKDYVFSPDKYGKYTIVYTASDSSGRKATSDYVMTVKDRIKPVLTVNGEVMKTATAGKTYTLPTATVTDNNDTKLPIYVLILAPDGELRANQDGDYTFAPMLKGEYKITYYTFDSYNCYTYVEYTIKVM